VTYNQRQESLRAEAMRVVPGVMAAKHRNDVTGAGVLMEQFHETATELGVTDGVAWSILWSATLHWAMEIADALSDNQEMPMEELLQRLGASALSWISAERGVGGY
jgi:hypothetical protein